MTRLFCIDRCTTCKAAKKDLKERGVAYDSIDLKTDPPTKEELTRWIKQHPRGIAAFFNTSGILYRELDMKTKRKELPEEELVELLSREGMLVKRPILEYQGEVIVGYKKDMYEDFFDAK